MINISALALSVALVESSLCTSPAAISTHNCTSIMTWESGHRELKVFRSKGESLMAFRALWLKKYGDRLPTIADARAYVGDTGAERWQKGVLWAYWKYVKAI